MAYVSAGISIPTDFQTNFLMLLRWIHLIAGITWIGLLYFFNLVNVPLMKELDATIRDKNQPRATALTARIGAANPDSAKEVFALLRKYATSALVSSRSGACTPAIISDMSAPMLPRPSMRSTMRSTTAGHLAA